MPTNRRDFLIQSAAGLALAGFGVGRLFGSRSEEYLQEVPASSGAAYAPLDDIERRRLLDLAHFGAKPEAAGRKAMAVTSHPLATRAAVRVLREGGNACDAALTASLCQTVVEPHMTTLTGVFSLLYYDAATGSTLHLNGSNNAPLAPLKDFKLQNLMAELRTGRGVTVPGFWAGVEAAHERFGRLPRRRILAPAIHYARNGFETHPFLWGEVFTQLELIGQSTQGREIYMPGNAILKPGAMLYQKRAADLLERLAEEGGEYFYRGAFAQKFSEVVKEAGGVITPADFEAYRVMWQEPARSSYREYEVCGSPPPDFGGAAMIEILNMVELMDLQAMGPAWDSLETAWKFLQILGEVLTTGIVQRHMKNVTPLEKLISKEYAAERFAKLTGMPKGLGRVRPPAMPPLGSNHLTVVDAEGNAATVLHSCMSFPWSNGLFVEGINICAAGAHYGVGMPAPGKRIHARICPTIVFKGGRPVLASGSPSVSLMQNILQNITNLLDFGMSCGESVRKPRFGGGSIGEPGASLVEADLKPGILEGLRDRKLRIDIVNPWNWHHGSFEGVWIDPGSGLLTACADPRRAGMAEGY